MTHILSINFGSTSTKIAVYEDDRFVLGTTIYHDSRQPGDIENISDRLEMRRSAVEGWLQENDCGSILFDAVAARGGLMRRIPGGVWKVNEDMIADLMSGAYGVHVCNLCACLAYEMYGKKGIPCFVVDAPVTDELEDLARISGYQGIERQCYTHALNQKASARMAAEKLEKDYKDCRLIVAHMGGGITVAAHKNGRIIDSSDGLNGEGPFSPERSGSVPALALVDEFFAHHWTKEQLKQRITGAGGMVSYTGTSDMRRLVSRSKEDKGIALLIRAMCYQIAKEICAFAAVLGSAPDAVVLTGGLAHSPEITDLIQERVQWMARVFVFPGEDENRALAAGALRALRGEEPVQEYHR